MMDYERFIVLLLFFLLSSSAIGQKKWQSYTVEVDRNYSVKNEGSTYRVSSHSPTDEFITSELYVNDDTIMTIHSSEGSIQKDTAVVVLYDTSPAYHQTYTITISKGKFFIKYHFITSGEDQKRRIITKKSRLILNSTDFRKGNTIKGYTEFEGECIEGCWIKDYVIKGNFTVTIK